MPAIAQGKKLTYWGGLIFSDDANKLLTDTINAWGAANGVATEVVMINQNETTQKVSAAVSSNTMPDALDMGLGLARLHQLDRLRRGGVAVRRIDQLVGRDVELALPGGGFDLGARSDQDGLDQAELRRVDRGGQRALVARMSDRRGHRRQRPRDVDEALVLLVCGACVHADFSSWTLVYPAL